MSGFMGLLSSISSMPRSVFPEDKPYKPNPMLAVSVATGLMILFAGCWGNIAFHSGLITTILAIVFAWVIGFLVRFLGRGAHFGYGIIAVLASLGTIFLGEVYYTLLYVSNELGITVRALWGDVDFLILMKEIVKSTSIFHLLCYMLTFPVAWKISFYEPNDRMYEERAEKEIADLDFDSVDV